tara:strand:+ start:529 stop:1044 length:516 start_codon:yes stop_codon:yes gene_type:complete
MGPAMADIELEFSHVEHLTARHRACLRLVARRKSATEIARILKISKPAVDQCLLSACRVLSVSNQDEAAQLYARLSGSNDRITVDPVAPFAAAQGVREKHSKPYMLDVVPLPCEVDIQHDSSSWPQLLAEAKGNWGAAPRMAILAILTIGTLAIVLIGLSVSQSLSELLMS